MKVLVTICGRAGSKGVGNKNFRLFLEEPMIYYTIKAAKLFKEKNQNIGIDICLNSDNEIAKKIALEENLFFVERPNELASDTASKVDAIRDVLLKMEKNENKRYNYIIDLDITSPLRKVSDIENILNKEIETQSDVVFSVVPSRRNPYFNMVEKLKDDKIVFSKPSSYVRRQDTPEVYDMNASIYCYKRDTLAHYKIDPFNEKIDIIVMKDTYVLDIDHEEDFNIMECLIKNYYKDEFKEIFEK